MSYNCERISEGKGKRIKFMKDAEAYLYSVVDDEAGASAAVFEMKPDGIFKLKCRANNIVYMKEGALLVHDQDTDKMVGIYPGDMAFFTRGTKIRCRTDGKLGCKCIIVSKPPLKAVYPELEDLFTGGQVKIKGIVIPSYQGRLKQEP